MCENNPASLAVSPFATFVRGHGASALSCAGCWEDGALSSCAARFQVCSPRHVTASSQGQDRGKGPQQCALIVLDLLRERYLADLIHHKAAAGRRVPTTFFRNSANPRHPVSCGMSGAIAA